MQVDIFEQWIAEKVVAAFAARGIEISPEAQKLLRQALTAQIDEGLVEDDAELIALVNRLPVADLPVFYRLKYGDRPLTFNRMIRLLSDLHERWVDLRACSREL